MGSAATWAALALTAAACTGADAQRPGPSLPSRPSPDDAGASSVPSDAPAAATPDAYDAAGIVSVEVPVGDSGYTRGRSTTIVKAPIRRVRDAVLGFARYPEFMPHYEKCRVLGRTPTGGRDIYMEVSALHGALKMWARVEIPKAAYIEGAETYASRFIEGNVQELQAIWRLEAIDPAQTRLSLEVFLKPKLPLPKRMINAENLSGSAKAIAAMRTYIEKGGAASRR